MDTVNKVAKAATKAIWGEQSGEEPVSGQQGNVAAGEPYDAGNMGGKFTPGSPKQTHTDQCQRVNPT